MKGIVTNNGELKVSVRRNASGLITGGLVLGDTLLQDQELLLMSHPGDFKTEPLLGVGIGNYLNDDDTSVSELHARIERQYKMCGFKIKKLTGLTPITTQIVAVRDE